MAPQPKVVAGGAAGAASVVIIFIASQFGLEIPGEVGAALAALISFGGAYLKA
jgi:hypothetical protein